MLPQLGGKKVQSIRKSELNEYILHLYNHHRFARSTIENHRAVLSGIFSFAVDEDIIFVNPSIGLMIPKKAKKPAAKALYSKELLLQFLNAAIKLPIGLMVILCLYHGMRRGEACGLMWTDIDWERGIIHLERQRTTIEGQVIEKNLKYDSKRSLYLTDRSAAYLRAELDNQRQNKVLFGDDYHDTGYVVVGNDGSVD